MNRLGLNSASLNPININFPIYQPVPEDIAILERAFDRKAKRKENANKLAAAMQLSLNDLDLNPAEDAWRQDFVNKYTTPIQTLLDDGSFADAAELAVKLGTAAKTDPGLRGRLRAQQEYKNFVETTKRRTDIDQRTKDWALAMNPYSYKDKTDESGNLIGGEEWIPTVNPVSQVNLSALGEVALKWAKPTKTSGTSAMFVDEFGNLTKDINKAVDIAYTTSTSTERLGKDKLREAINAAIDMTTGARAAIEQDYKVAEWEYNKLSPKQKENLGETEFTDSNGRTLTREEFLAKKINPWIDVSVINNSDSKTNYGSGLSTSFALKQQQKANDLANGIYGAKKVDYTGTGYNITYNISDYLAKAQGTIEDAIRDIENLMPAISTYGPWRTAKTTGNYAKLESIIKNAKTRDGKNYFGTKNAQVHSMVNGALRRINNNYSFVEDTFKGIDKETKDALLFKSAIDAGQRLPDNNKNTKAFYSFLNDLSKGKNAEKYRITFNDKSDVDDFLKKLGMNEGTARQNGLDFGYDNGFTTITIKKNANILPKAVMSFFEGNDDVFSAFWNRSKITAVDNKGNDINDSWRGNIIDTTFARFMSPIVHRNADNFNNLRQVVNRTVNVFNNSGRGTRSTDQLKLADLPAIADAKRQYGDISPEYERAVKVNNRELSNRLAGSDWTQLGVYGYDENTRGLTIMPNVNKGEQIASIIAHIQNDKATIQSATNGIENGYYITLHEALDSKNNLSSDGKPKTFFITTGIEDDAMRRLNSDTSTRAMAEYNRRRSVTGSYRNYLGETVSNIGNERCIINGRSATKQDALKVIEKDKLIDDIVSGIKSGEIPVHNVEELQLVIASGIQKIVNETGISSSEEIVELQNIISNKLK